MAGDQGRGCTRGRRCGSRTGPRGRAAHRSKEGGGAPAPRPAALGLVVSGLVVLPALVAIVLTVGHRRAPVDDFAIIDLACPRRVVGHPPLTGLLSRNGWNHPGPAQFWLRLGVRRDG